MGRKLANNGVERHKNSAREAAILSPPQTAALPAASLTDSFFAFFANCGAWSLAIFTFTSVSVNFCVESVYVRSSIIQYYTKKRTKTNKINSALLSFSTKEQFYNINMARYRVSQKFVPLISCTIIFDQNLLLHEISRRCLFLYREHMLRISVTDMPFLFCFVFFLSHSVAVAAWYGTRRVDPQMIHFELFYHLVRRS